MRNFQHIAKHQTGGRPFVGCARLLIQYRPIHNYPSYWKPFLQPQPDDASCHGNRVTLITISHRNSRKKYFFVLFLPHPLLLSLMWSFHNDALNDLISPDASIKMPCPPPVTSLGSCYSRSIDSKHTDKATGWIAGNQILIPSSSKEFYLRRNIQVDCWTHPASYPLVKVIYFPGIQWPDPEPAHLRTSSAIV